MTGRLAVALVAVDAANAADPKGEAGLYAQRMTAELARLEPRASEVLQIACRGQHVERWLLPRADFAIGKAGYLAWRREQGRRHAARVAGIMAAAGYWPQDCDRVAVLLRKEGIKRDAEVQALEDVICFVFLRWYFGPFTEGKDPAAVLDIVAKTAGKMSAAARGRVLVEFSLPERLAAAFRR
ncbi:MAG: DUF4202 domain-containing protein [Paracoccaceae bacterium]